MQPETEQLPLLRPELRLMPGAATPGGEPTWLIHDALQNRYIQIDAVTYETLALWSQCRTAGDLIGRVAGAGRISLDCDGVSRLVAFLHENNLTAEPPRDGWRYYAGQEARARRSTLSWLMHNYLFFRIPLVQPHAFLKRTLPVARVLGSRSARRAIAALGLVGLYLVSRQWDEFITTFHAYFTWDGMLLMALTLFGVKAAHELGHAYVAVHYGCRVPTMGIAFMMLAPLLYTDVTDAWRLRDRRQRFAIDSAGIKVELALAAVALFLWSFLPEGPARGAAFVVTAVSLLSSLIININPFMRFDGYYLLSEMLGVDNLQQRAFVLGRWRLREWLFRLGEPNPEQLSPRLNRILVVYAYLTWLYRLVLFVGIALIVYHYFFKALGLLLFAVEIVYFVARPVWSELGVWYKSRNAILRSPRGITTSIGAVAAAVLLCVPWSTRVVVPAVVESARMQGIHSNRPGRVAAVHVRHGELVREGQPLVTLSSADIDQEVRLTRTRLRLAEQQHGRRGADPEDRRTTLVLERTIPSLKSRLAGLEREREELVIRAPFAGRVAELNPELHAGRWIGPKEALAVVAGGGLVVRGYLAETDLWRVGQGSSGQMVLEHPLRRDLDVRVDQIAAGGSSFIEVPELSSTFGGPIAVTADAQKRLSPLSAQYLVVMSAGLGETDLAARGVALLEGSRESLLARVWRQTLQVLIREMGA